MAAMADEFQRREGQTFSERIDRSAGEVIDGDIPFTQRSCADLEGRKRSVQARMMTVRMVESVIPSRVCGVGGGR